MRRHIAQSWRGLVAVLVVAGFVEHLAAQEQGQYLPPPPGTSAPVAPRYLNQQPAEVRPLETSPPPADPRARYNTPEQAAAGIAEYPKTSTPAGDAQPLPLGPPSDEEHDAKHAGEMPPVVTAGASLGIVLGLFLLVVWVVRRGMPRHAAMLPREVVEVLGRVPLVAHKQVHLLKCGNKLLLVCDSPAGVHTLTEITEAAEIERLSELCRPSAGSPLRQMLHPFGTPARDRRYLARHEAADLDFAHLEAGHGKSRV